MFFDKGMSAQETTSSEVASTSGACASNDSPDFTSMSGLTHECGLFGCVAAGEWPTQIDVPQVICLGLVALQHR